MTITEAEQAVIRAATEWRKARQARATHIRKLLRAANALVRAVDAMTKCAMLEHGAQSEEPDKST